MALLGRAAVAWPLAARAQQAERMRRIDVLESGAEDDPVPKPRLAGFRQGLERLGWSEGRNVHIDRRCRSLSFRAIAARNSSAQIDNLCVV
jgi:putative tryptophan/tyrosine transport system substrate-binding protein